MATLFRETRSILFLSIIQVINEIYAGKRHSKNTIVQRLQQSFPDGEPFPPQDEENLVDMLFHFLPDGRARLVYEAPIPFIPSREECHWLQQMITDDQTAFLLPLELRKKLQQRLADHPLPIPWKKFQAKGDEPSRPPLLTTLSLIWQALREKRHIRYVNISRKGTVYHNEAIPLRLEYDAAANRWRVIIWSETEERAIKLNACQLKKIMITEQPSSPDIEEKFQAFLTARRQTLHLLLNARNTAEERCFALFSSYDKESYLDTSGTYHLKIFFYDFDRNEILYKLLSLGPAVTVIRPADIQAKIIHRLHQAATLYDLPLTSSRPLDAK